jgi:hypothetical protein
MMGDGPRMPWLRAKGGCQTNVGQRRIVDGPEGCALCFAWRILPRRASVHGHTHWRWLSPTKASAKGGRDEEVPPASRPLSREVKSSSAQVEAVNITLGKNDVC